MLDAAALTLRVRAHTTSPVTFQLFVIIVLLKLTRVILLNELMRSTQTPARCRNAKNAKMHNCAHTLVLVSREIIKETNNNNEIMTMQTRGMQKREKCTLDLVCAVLRV